MIIFEDVKHLDKMGVILPNFKFYYYTKSNIFKSKSSFPCQTLSESIRTTLSARLIWLIAILKFPL